MPAARSIAFARTGTAHHVDLRDSTSFGLPPTDARAGEEPGQRPEPQELSQNFRMQDGICQGRQLQ